MNPGFLGDKTMEGKKGMFQKKQPEGQNMSEFINQINNLNERLRILEERYTNLDRKFEVIESNMLDEQRRVDREIKTINSEIIELKTTMDEFKDKINLIINELSTFASKEQIDVLKKYIDLWDPVRFATKKELEMALKSKKE